MASGSGWNLWVWLVGVVVRRYRFPLLLLYLFFFCSSILFVHLKNVSFLFQVIKFYVLNNFSRSINTYGRLLASHGSHMKAAHNVLYRKKRTQTNVSYPAMDICMTSRGWVYINSGTLIRARVGCHWKLCRNLHVRCASKCGIWTTTLCYIQLLNLPPLSVRREYLKLTAMYNILNGYSYYPSGIFVQSNNRYYSSQSTNVNFLRPYARTNYSFVPNVVHAWNNLPYFIKTSPCIYLYF